MVNLPLVLSLSLSLGVWLYAERARHHQAARLTYELDQLNGRLLATVDYGQRLAQLRRELELDPAGHPR